MNGTAGNVADEGMPTRIMENLFLSASQNANRISVASETLAGSIDRLNSLINRLAGQRPPALGDDHPATPLGGDKRDTPYMGAIGEIDGALISGAANIDQLVTLQDKLMSAIERLEPIA